MYDTSFNVFLAMTKSQYAALAPLDVLDIIFVNVFLNVLKVRRVSQCFYHSTSFHTLLSILAFPMFFFSKYVVYLHCKVLFEFCSEFVIHILTVS